MEVTHLNINLMENFDSCSHNIKLFCIRSLDFSRMESKSSAKEHGKYTMKPPYKLLILCSS